MNVSKKILSIVLLMHSNFSVALAEPTTSADRKLTSKFTLKNEIPVVVRETPGSEIVHIEIGFKTGTSDF
jgi:predicted Zn-dependent peptidase